VAEIWNGEGWTVQHPEAINNQPRLGPDPWNFVTAVACTSSSSCIGTGYIPDHPGRRVANSFRYSLERAQLVAVPRRPSPLCSAERRVMRGRSQLLRRRRGLQQRWSAAVARRAAGHPLERIWLETRVHTAHARADQ
jgi:hypothetical protein